MKKRAQVTIFIILGIIVLISVGLFLTIKSSIKKEEIAPGVTRIVEELPSEFLPLKPYVEKCAEKTAKEGLIMLGQRGGYAYPDKLKPGQQSTEGDSVRFSKQSELIIPYWFFLASPNSCVGECKFEGRELPLKKSTLYDSIEAQLARYVENNLRCILASCFRLCLFWSLLCHCVASLQFYDLKSSCEVIYAPVCQYLLW